MNTECSCHSFTCRCLYYYIAVLLRGPDGRVGPGRHRARARPPGRPPPTSRSLLAPHCARARAVALELAPARARVHRGCLRRPRVHQRLRSPFAMTEGETTVFLLDLPLLLRHCPVLASMRRGRIIIHHRPRVKRPKKPRAPAAEAAEAAVSPSWALCGLGWRASCSAR
jgi:hypothetical protein